MRREFELTEEELDEISRFHIDSNINREYRRFNAEGSQITVHLQPPIVGDDTNPVSHFLDSVTDLFEYALRNHNDSDMVGITITNEINVRDKAIRISFRRKDQITPEVIWSVFDKVTQSNASFNALDKMILVVQSVKMPVGHGCVKCESRPLEAMIHLKKVS